MRYYNGNFIRKGDNDPTSAAANGVYNLEAQLIHKGEGRWPATFNLEVAGDPTADFVEVSLRHIDSDIYMGSIADYDGNYDVTEVSIPSTFSGSARIYLGVKISIATGSTFYADVPIAAIQILNSAGTSLLESFVFSDDNQSWENLGTLTQISGSSTIGFPESLATSAARTFGGTLDATVNEDKFSLASSTGSNNTGAEGGISTVYKTTADGGSDTILPLGAEKVAQVNGSNYLYREASGSTRYSGVVCRSPAYTFSGSEKIRICHAVTGYSQERMNPDDTLYLGVA